MSRINDAGVDTYAFLINQKGNVEHEWKLVHLGMFNVKVIGSKRSIILFMQIFGPGKIG